MKHHHSAIIAAEQVAKNEELKKNIIEMIQKYPGNFKDIAVIFVSNKFEIDLYWKSSYKDFRRVLAAVDRGLAL